MCRFIIHNMVQDCFTSLENNNKDSLSFFDWLSSSMTASSHVFSLVIHQEVLMSKTFQVWLMIFWWNSSFILERGKKKQIHCTFNCFKLYLSHSNCKLLLLLISYYLIIVVHIIIIIIIIMYSLFGLDFSLLRSTSEVESLSTEYAPVLPSEEDLTGAALALIRLQDTYNLNMSEMAAGKISGSPAFAEMTGKESSSFVHTKAYTAYSIQITLYLPHILLLRDCWWEKKAGEKRGTLKVIKSVKKKTVQLMADSRSSFFFLLSFDQCSSFECNRYSYTSCFFILDSRGTVVYSNLVLSESEIILDFSTSHSL